MLTQPSEPTWKTVIRLLRWHKPAGRLILMIPALWAVVLAAQGTPPLPLIGIIILGTLATSAAGCVANDLWDRNIDNQVERTQSRPLASRALSIKTGIVVGLVALFCAAGLASYLNRFSFALCVAAVPVILLYPAAQRVFPVPQLVLSLAWGFAVLISWSAVEGGLTASTWWLWGATVWWTLGFDTIYALSDRDDDLKIGINSTAIFFAEAVVGAIADWILANNLGIPIWIPLAEFTEPTLVDHLQEKWLKSAGVEGAITSLQNHKEHLWLLMDGLDEMVARIERPQVSQLLTGWVGLGRAIVTCRVNVWEADKNEFSGFDVYRNLPFEVEQMEMFIRRFFAQSD